MAAMAATVSCDFWERPWKIWKIWKMATKMATKMAMFIYMQILEMHLFFGEILVVGYELVWACLDYVLKLSVYHMAKVECGIYYAFRIHQHFSVE